MNSIVKLMALVILLIMPLMAVVAQVDPGTVELANADFLKLFLESLGGLKGASTLGIVGVVSQLLMAALQTPFFGNLLGEKAGKYKLLAIYLFNVVGGVAGLMLANDMSLLPALLHANSLAALSIMGHQALIQFKKED